MCASDSGHRRNRRAFGSPPRRDGREPGPEPDLRRTRCPPREPPGTGQSPAQFRRNSSFCRGKFSSARSRRSFGRAFPPDPTVENLSVCGRRELFSTRIPLCNASEEFWPEFPFSRRAGSWQPATFLAPPGNLMRPGPFPNSARRIHHPLLRPAVRQIVFSCSFNGFSQTWR